MYKCQTEGCGALYTIKMGKCKECGEFGTLIEVPDESNLPTSSTKQNTILPVRYNYKDNHQELIRYGFSSNSLNQIFGGGLVKGSVNYLSAEPGAGKSTFLGELAQLLEDKTLHVCYYSGEENVSQVGDRLKRIYEDTPEVLDRIDVYYGESLEEVIGIINRDSIDIVIVDSLQKIRSESKDGDSGSISQQKYCIDKLTFALKNKGITGFIIGHVNKEGDLAGAKSIEHIVDGVYIIEGQDSRTDSVRLLKCLKGRFGGTDNVVVMMMGQKGFTILDPEHAFKAFVLESGTGNGSVFCPTLEGNQLFLLEVQALLTTMLFSNPKRTSIGMSFQKLDILLAVILNITKFPVDQKDVFINVIGPVTKNTTGLDLGVVASILSYLLGKDVKHYLFIGQVGLMGEIRTIPRQQEIIRKLNNLGYSDEQIVTRDTCKDIRELLSVVFKQKLVN